MNPSEDVRIKAATKHMIGIALRKQVTLRNLLSTIKMKFFVYSTDRSNSVNKKNSYNKY
ncbi:hypothetical protein Gbth_013_015 [Gluconobacter thailandicus F149-1 = NBRC 100600]|nr:hypothetical protein Gbfr_005_015 [Gluconobacter frateurii M-2]GAN92607.1 hypothetical protein Gbth_013_015 [Gluconobacter thailandicus F149-1 = NBRC 100600]GEL86522.1 hypothetical protein GTH01_08800 [Gluconobacter thailandicus F149-1 = NBRC 100600]